MTKTIGSVMAIIALAVGAFTLAYVGGGLMRSDPVEPAGAALRAPVLVANTKPVAMRTPTATPSPSPTATPKPKKKKHKKKQRPKKKTTTVNVQPRVTAVPTRVATAVPTQVYHPPVQRQQSKPKPKPTPGIIIED